MKAKELRKFLTPFFAEEERKVLRDLENPDKDLTETRIRYQVVKELAAYFDVTIGKEKMYRAQLDKAVHTLQTEENGG